MNKSLYDRNKHSIYKGVYVVQKRKFHGFHILSFYGRYRPDCFLPIPSCSLAIEAYTGYEVIYSSATFFLLTFGANVYYWKIGNFFFLFLITPLRCKRILLDIRQFILLMRSGDRAVASRTVHRGDSGSIPFRNLGNFVHPHFLVSFGRDTKSRWSLLSGVYARGSKISHTGGNV